MSMNNIADQLAPVDPRLARHAMPTDKARGVDRVSAADQRLLQIAGPKRAGTAERLVMALSH